ncbi:aminoglycoside 6-adenylyltransferase [Amycolatopsis sp. 195334CR]|uniref:aminoglycoside 6-adenylyltransferase n=1 Tax=Amycolatopsis sp. 195334CR TaxID=2814588 RepID=UPI001A90604D|nr:aminoglycoside 6-adenylyltransferase [Amycolatopsis sp. 195334CR]MBN6042189.1 aminoglycoside 6-adenylyltransferase [Amycolatopsis sp. 195334CR]
MDYGQALSALVSWAEGRREVRTLVLTGSAAAGSAHPLSDRDVQVFTTDPAALLDDESWWAGLGEVLVVERLEDGDGNPTRLVYYAGGKIDFTLLPAGALENKTYDRSYTVLLDKDGSAATTSLVPEEVAAPSREEFDESVHWAWAAALMTAKAIVRDEPWSAKLRDQDLKEELLRMIEWDHRARYGPAFDTRYLGTRLRAWMDEDVQAELEQCWSGFGAPETERALLATVTLYRRLAERTAGRLGFPVFGHERVAAELHTILRSGPK